jgi:hypothetical protein
VVLVAGAPAAPPLVVAKPVLFTVEALMLESATALAGLPPAPLVLEAAEALAPSSVSSLHANTEANTGTTDHTTIFIILPFPSVKVAEDRVLRKQPERKKSKCEA